MKKIIGFLSCFGCLLLSGCGTPGSSTVLEEAERLLSSNTLTGAIAVLDEWSDKNGDNYEVLLRLGDLYQQQGEIDKAIIARKGAQRIEPSGKNQRSLVKQISLFLDQKRLDEAGQNIEQALQTQQNPDIIELQARFFRLVGKTTEAIEKYKEAVLLDPSKDSARSQLGILTADEGDLSGSLLHFDKAIEIASGNVIHWFNKGTVLSDLGYIEKDKDISKKALAHFEQASEIDPGYMDALIYQVITLNDLEDFDAAIVRATKTLISVKDEPNILFYRGIAYAKTGEKEKAKKDFLKVLEIDPTHGFASQQLDMLE